jgi:hypothetical protein
MDIVSMLVLVVLATAAVAEVVDEASVGSGHSPTT